MDTGGIAGGTEGPGYLCMSGAWKTESRRMSRFVAGATKEKIPSRATERGRRSRPDPAVTSLKVRKYLWHF